MTTFFRDSDIPTLMQDFGVPVVIGAVTTKGIVDYVGRDALPANSIAGVSGTIITVSVQTSILPTPLPNKTACTVDGVPYKIRDQVQLGDGALTHLICEK